MSDTNERDFSEVSRITAEKEATAYDLFSQRFDREFPAPEKAAVKLMNAIGWQFVTICIQSFASILLAALRTAHMFFEAASAANITIRYLDAGVSVFAIEFGIVIFAAIKAEIENRKTVEEDLRSALNINVNLLWAGIIACVIISIVAGLGTSLAGFGLDVEWFKWALVIGMGGGASVVAWVSGDILGAMLARLNNARALADLEYRKEQTERDLKKRSMWEAAPERQIARSELVELKEYLQGQRQPRARQPKVPQPLPQPQPRPKTSTRSNEVRGAIYEYLDRTFAMEQRIAGPSELHREKGVSKGYASDVIKDWQVERNIPTSETPEEQGDATE